MRAVSRSGWVPTALGVVLLVAAWPASPARADDGALPPGATKIAVSADLPVFTVQGREGDARVIIYLHGRCGDPLAGIRSFPDVARAHGTLISMLGDTPCPGGRRRKWTGSLDRIQARIDAAVAAVGESRGAPLDAGRMTVLGYSEGALRAESLAKRFPERYPRVVMVASPRAPTPAGFRAQQTLVTMVGDRDVQTEMKTGTTALERAGLRVRLFLLPGARHGQYGDDGPKVVGEALTWSESE